MSAVELDALTWPQVQAHIEAGRDTVVVALGATEQHGRHLPLATDALLGDHLACLLAERLDAFLGPTLRVGCSEHHLGFAGTLSLSESTFHAVVADLVRSLLSGGFRRIVLVSTHGGNFAPLATAVAKLDQPRAVTALTDLGVLFQGSPKLSVQPHPTNPALVPASFYTNLETERAKTENDIKNYKYYPVVGIGLSFGF